MTRVNIYVNDCDEDVCGATFCLTQSHLVEGTINPAINRYIGATGIKENTEYPSFAPHALELRKDRDSGGMCE